MPYFYPSIELQNRIVMKRIVILTFIVIGLMTYSCQKEVIHPKDTNNQVELNSGSTAIQIEQPNTSTSVDSDNPGKDITDPNNDPDISRKKGHR